MHRLTVSIAQWLTFAPVSTTSAVWFDTDVARINWFATAFLFAFVAATPYCIYVLHSGGPRQAILISSALLLLGNWIRFAGAKTSTYPVVMFGQILTGLAQPFVLAAPTRYSDLWFTSRGRVGATAVMSLANPFGGAVGQLINPLWCTESGDVPSMVLWISIIATVACIPSFFLPAGPPTPAAASGTHKKLDIAPSLRRLARSREFWLVLLPFNVYVGLFNSLSSLLNGILYPFGYTEDEAGIAGAVLIVVGLVAAAVTSPIVDRTKRFVWTIKALITVSALAYLAFIWAPPTRALAAPYAILAVLGAASFSLVPVGLEFLTEITYPVSPEITSALCWSGGQALGGIFIVVSDALAAGSGTDGPGGDKPHDMQRALWMYAALALAMVPLPWCLGMFGRAEHVRLKRFEADRERETDGLSDVR
jgi:MFS family permease